MINARLAQWLALCICSAGLWNVVAAGAEPAPPAELDEALKEMLSYQASVRSLRCKWTSRGVYPKGSMKFEASATARGEAGEAYEAPSEDTTVESVTTFAMEGQKVFSEVRESVWSHSARAFLPFESTHSIVSGVSRDKNPRDSYGIIDHGGDLRSSSGYSPIWIAYRLFDPVLGKAKPENLVPVGSAVHDGHRCIVVDAFEPDGTGYRTRYWIAEDIGCCVVKWQQIWPDSSVRRDCDMRYARDEKVGWHLQSWELRSIRVQGSSTDTVTEVQINEPIDPAVFEITFPVGMKVYDRIKGTEYISDGEGPTPSAATHVK